MPIAPLRPCAGNCGSLVSKGKCSSCARTHEQQRGTASQRGYDTYWLRFRRWLITEMVRLGILPVCGATLPGGPLTADSRCRTQGLLTFTSQDGSSLHHDHEPPLREHERSHRSAVCNAKRIQLLCAECHSAKTAAEHPGTRSCMAGAS